MAVKDSNDCFGVYKISKSMVDKTISVILGLDPLVGTGDSSYALL